MSQNRKSFEEQSLVLGERLNWSFFLGSAVLKHLDSIIQEEGNLSEQKVRESVMTLFDMCVTDWIDEQFQVDLKKCVEKVEIDLRKEFCGVKVGKPKIKEIEKINPHLLAHAIYDLWWRRNLLQKPVWTEQVSGKSFREEDFADLEDPTDDNQDYEDYETSEDNDEEELSRSRTKIGP